jgi:uncharacterized protein (TIGR02231 family)
MEKSMKSLGILMILLGSFVCAQKPVFTSAKVKSATVYFNSAELSQTASVQLVKGSNEIVVKNVADYLQENTLQIGMPKNITVLSAQFTQNYISEYEIDETSPQTKRVRDSVNLVQKEIQKIQNDKTNLQMTIQLLDKNQQVSGTESGLKVDELMKLVDFYKKKRTDLGMEVYDLTEKEGKLNEILQKLNARLQINTSKDEKTSKGKLVLQVMSETTGMVNFDLNYLTSGATWTPFYDLRVENVKSPIDMTYKAQIVQNTGIDWKQTKLTLSSGNPNQNNQAPLLHTWFVDYMNENYYLQNPTKDLRANVIQGYASGVQVEEAELNKKSTMSDYTTIVENQLNVSFEIDVLYDILSNNKQHGVALKEIKLPAKYKYYTVPKMEAEAYLMAELEDYSQYNMLPGEANIIFEGMYVGKTFINPNQTVETLNLSMGRDKRVSVKREMVNDKSSTKFLSNYKEQVFTYDITVRNNKKDAVNLMVKDQYPMSSNKEIEVTLLEKDGASVNEETSVLTWTLDLKPGETKKLRISYKVKYPKDKFIGGL